MSFYLGKDNSSARREDGTINESAVTMDISLTDGYIWIK